MLNGYKEYDVVKTKPVTGVDDYYCCDLCTVYHCLFMNDSVVGIFLPASPYTYITLCYDIQLVTTSLGGRNNSDPL